MVQKHQIADLRREEKAVHDRLDSTMKRPAETHSDCSCAMNRSFTPLLMMSSELNVTRISAYDTSWNCRCSDLIRSEGRRDVAPGVSLLAAGVSGVLASSASSTLRESFSQKSVEGAASLGSTESAWSGVSKVRKMQQMSSFDSRNQRKTRLGTQREEFEDAQHGFGVGNHGLAEDGVLQGARAVLLPAAG